MEKQINNLNSKTWYRFLKVIFIFIFIIVILMVNGANIGEGIGRIDDDKTLIYCNGEDRKVLTARQAGVYFDNYDFIKGFDYKNFYGDYHNERKVEGILEACLGKRLPTHLSVKESTEWYTPIVERPKGEYIPVAERLKEGYIEEKLKEVDDIYLIQRFYEIKGLKNSPKKYDEGYLKEQIRIMTEGYKSRNQKTSYLNYNVHLFNVEPAYTYKDFVLSSLVFNFSIFLFFEVLRRIFYYIVLGTISPKK